MTFKHAFSVMMLSLVVFGIAVQPSVADQGIGFGWESDASQEALYKVDLETGASSKLGTFPDLKTVVVGSHNVDYPTGVSVFIGSKSDADPDTLFVTVPSTKLIYAFKLVGLASGVSVQRALIRSSDSSIFILTSERGAASLDVSKVTFNMDAASAALTKIGSIEVSAYSLDGIKIGDDGKIYILKVGDTVDEVLTFNTANSATASIPLSTKDHQGLFLCNQSTGTPQLFSFLNIRTPSVSTSLSKLLSTGAEETALSNIDLVSLAGTYICTKNVLRFLGPVGNALKLYNWDATGTDTNFDATPLSASNVKFVGLTKAKAASQRKVFAGARARFALLTSSNFKKCIKQLGSKNPLPKGRSVKFKDIAKGISKIKRADGICARA